MFNISNKKILITGAANGNGRAIAQGLSSLGATVILVDKDAQGLQQTSRSIAVDDKAPLTFSVDISDQLACAQLAQEVADQVGDIDALVNNAGVLRRARFDEDNAHDELSLTMSVNVNGTYNMTKSFLGSLKTTQGNVVNVASIQSFVAAKTAHTYAISKGAVAQMTRTLAAELADFNIRVNAIAPGIIETAMSKSTRSDAQVFQSFLNHVPMSRSAKPEELIGPVAFLVSDAASYVTGAIVPVDGGYLTI